MLPTSTSFRATLAILFSVLSLQVLAEDERKVIVLAKDMRFVGAATRASQYPELRFGVDKAGVPDMGGDNSINFCWDTVQLIHKFPVDGFAQDSDAWNEAIAKNRKAEEAALAKPAICATCIVRGALHPDFAGDISFHLRPGTDFLFPCGDAHSGVWLECSGDGGQPADCKDQPF